MKINYDIIKKDKFEVWDKVKFHPFIKSFDIKGYNIKAINIRDLDKIRRVVAINQSYLGKEDFGKCITSVLLDSGDNEWTLPNFCWIKVE